MASLSCLRSGWIVALACLTTLTLSMPTDQYMKDREKMLQKDRSTGVGHDLTLTPDEKIVSDVMVQEKRKMIEFSKMGKHEYIPSLSFYRSKPLLENTTVYKLIRQMPKGAALHLHDMAITSLDWLVNNVTYRDHLYMCVDIKTHFMTFQFSKGEPKKNINCPWKLVKNERRLAGNVADFDNSIKKNISMLSTDPLVNYPDLAAVWERFLAYFGQVHGMIFYAPVFKDYFKQALKEFSDDNVQYIELRGLFSGVFDLDGTTHDIEYALQSYRNTTKEFLKENPDFSGAKFIMSGIRSFPQADIMQQVKTTIELRQKYPESMLGYDLVGQEDPNNSLLHYKKELLYASQSTPAIDLPYFFHAAETNWQGTDTDYNLIDAILLNTTRIGHGFGLVKHPSLVASIKEKGIAVEVNPISNQILGLVKDLRNHALVPLMAENVPVVISSDDPVVWEAAPLSHDFYMAFMNMCGEDADLRFLKQLANNSIKYSAMSRSERTLAMASWQQKWNKFIKQAVNSLKQGGYKN